MQERQLDSVADLLDLPREATDVVVADVGDLLEHEVLDLGLRDPLERVAGLGVHEQRVAGTQPARTVVRQIVTVVGGVLGQVLGGHQRLGQPHDAFFVGVADDQRAVPVRQDLAQCADLAHRFEVAGLDHSQRLVEANRLTLLEFLGIDVRRAGQAHLAPGGEHVDGVVVLHGQQHAVAAGRLAEPVDLLAQGQQLLAGFLERVHQLGVAGGERVDPGLELMHVTRTAQPARRTYRTFQLFAQNRRFPAKFFQFCSVFAGQTAIGGCPKDFRGFRTLGLTHIALLPRTVSWCGNNFNATGDSDFVCGLGIRHTSNTVNL